MSNNKHVTLAVPQAIEAAYLLIIGQIALIYSQVLFQIVAALTTRTVMRLTPDAWLVLVIVLIVPIVLIINILSGWVSTRNTFDEFEEYPNSLFVIDMLLVILFFILNNVVTYSVLPADGGDYLEQLVFPQPGQVAPTVLPLETRVAQTLPPFLYGIGGLICLMYVVWNVAHAHARKRIKGTSPQNPEMFAHNRFLLFAAFLHAVLLAVSVNVDHLVAESAVLVAWIALWVWLNGQWILTSPLSILAQKLGSPSESP